MKRLVLPATDETITRSFRFSEQAFRVIQEDAEKQRISVNTLMNHLIDSYVNFERYSKTMHTIKIPGQLLRYLLEAIHESMIIKVGQISGENIAESIILVKYGALTLDNIISHLRDLSRYGNLFEYNEVDTHEKLTISLVHQFGIKGSLLIAHYVQSIFNRINIHPFFHIAENAVTIEIIKEKV